jgi:hypothetical protein
MAIERTCPACDEPITVHLHDEEKGLKCPACGTQLLAPKPPKAAATSPRLKKRRRDDDDDLDHDPKPRRRSASPTSGRKASGVLTGVVVIIAGVVGIVTYRLCYDAVHNFFSGNKSGSHTQGSGPTLSVDPLLEVSTRPVYLADMREFDVRMGPWQLGKGHLGDPGHTPLVIRGKPAPKGLGVSPWDRNTTHLSYALGGKAEILSGAVGLNDHQVETYDPVVFAVVGDGKELWRSGAITRATGPETFRIDVRGVKLLELIVTAQGRHNAAHAVWIDPVIEK